MNEFQQFANDSNVAQLQITQNGETVVDITNNADSVDVAGTQKGIVALLFGIAQDCNQNAVPDACEIADGDARDANGDGIPDECQSVTGDVDGDGLVDFTDLLLVLGGFGSCPPDPCPEDVDGDGVVNFSDVLLVLANFG